MRARLVCLTLLACLACASCAALAKLGGVTLGAGAGSLAGPGGAAAGAAGGLFIAEATFPTTEQSPPPPETLWGLLSKIIDQGAWLVFVFSVLWFLTWFAPSPLSLLKTLVKRWRPSGRT